MRTVSAARLVSISFFVVLFFGIFVCPLHSETLIPLTVKKGTSLIKLARKYCQSEQNWQEIARINNLTPPYLIRDMSTLQIPLRLLNVEKLSARVATAKESVVLFQGKDELGQVQGNDLLHPGQTLVTDEEGYAYLVFPDNKFTRVAPDTQITLNYLLRLADGNLKTELLLTRGRIRHLIKQKLKQNETFRTRTPVAVTGVRGTDFRLKVTEDGGNIVETLSGTVNLSAAGKSIALNEGKGSMVVKGMAPTTPRLLPETPESIQTKSVYKALPVVFSLPVGKKGVQSFRVRITRDKEGNDPVVEQVVSSGSDITLASLSEGDFFYFITALDDDKYESLPAGPYPFTVRTIPAAPFFSSPKNASLSWEETMTVTWLESKEAREYQLELSDDNEFKHIIVSSQTKENNYTTPSLKPGTYYFRVRAVASDGFTSLNSLPLSWKVMKQTPVDLGSGSEDGDLTIQWAAAGESSTYELQIAQDDTFKDIIVYRKGLTSPACTLEEYIEPGNYSLRIRFSLEDGGFSPWTPPQKMAIEAGPVGIEHIILVATFFVLILL